MDSMYVLIWLLVGLLLVAPLLLYASRKTRYANVIIFGRGLVVAAAVYVVFALIEGSVVWVVVELAGVAVFTAIYRLARKSSINWLIVGWLVHPTWDGLIHMTGPGASIAPSWYVIACISFDWAIAIFLSTVMRTEFRTVD